jgi:hypothetical protein
VESGHEFVKKRVKAQTSNSQIVSDFTSLGWEPSGEREGSGLVDLFFHRPWRKSVALKVYPPGITTKLILVEKPYSVLFRAYAKKMKWQLDLADEENNRHGYIVYGWSVEKINKFLEEWEPFRADYCQKDCSRTRIDLGTLGRVCKIIINRA